MRAQYIVMKFSLLYELGQRKTEKNSNFLKKFSAVTAIDSSGVDTIYELRKTLVNRSIQVRQ